MSDFIEVDEHEHLPPEEPKEMNYSESLRYSQKIRRKIVDHFIGEKVPNDPKEIDTVLKALKDMDQTTLNERKNQIDQGAADSSRTVAEAMNEFVRLQMNRNPFQRAPDGSVQGVTVPTVAADKLGAHEIVPGETEVGVVVETSAEFMARMEAAREARGDED